MSLNCFYNQKIANKAEKSMEAGGRYRGTTQNEKGLAASTC